MKGPVKRKNRRIKYNEESYIRKNYVVGNKAIIPILLEKTDDLSVVEVRNKIRVGDTYELIVPGKIEPELITVQELFDYETKEKIDEVNPGKADQKVLMRLPDCAKDNYIIRRRK